MYEDDPGLEQRLSRFEAQLDRFGLALHQWRETQGSSHPPNAGDLDERLRALEDTVTREVRALQRIHEQPLERLQAQAEGLGELSRSLQTLVADLRISAVPQASGQGAASWPLERVVGLHDELRRAVNGGQANQDPLAPEAAEPRRLQRLPAAGAYGPLRPAHGAPFARRRWYVAGAVGVAAVLIVLGFRWMEARLDEAAARVAAAERQVVTATELANREVVAARVNADRQIAEAHQLAQRAETVGAILTAPDLIRFNLRSAETVGPSAQILWSRTRGIVLSGSRLPAAPPETTYQLWLVTSTQSVGIGLFVPDDAGRATLVVDVPPRVRGPVLSAAVTVEPTGGRATPSGRTLLARFP